VKPCRRVRRSFSSFDTLELTDAPDERSRPVGLRRAALHRHPAEAEFNQVTFHISHSQKIKKRSQVSKKTVERRLTASTRVTHTPQWQCDFVSNVFLLLSLRYPAAWRAPRALESLIYRHNLSQSSTPARARATERYEQAETRSESVAELRGELP